MSRRAHNKEINIVSLSFLDILSNTIGALAFLLLVFIIVVTTVTSTMHFLKLEILTDEHLPPATIGAPYKLACAAKGGDEPYHWEILGALPPGLSFDKDSGLLSGTPQAGQGREAKTYAFRLQVTDSHSKQLSRAEKRVELTVKPPPPLSWDEVAANPFKILTDALPAALIGKDYNLVLAAEGGLEPYTWSLTENIPGDFSVEGGVLTGNPQVAGKFFLILEGTDRLGSQDSKALEWEILPAQDMSKPGDNALFKIQSREIPAGIQGLPYSLTMAATGGVLPYSWELNGGALPHGLNLSTEGLLGGIPETLQESSFTIVVRDAQGHYDQKDFSMTIKPDVIIDTLKIETAELPPVLNATPYEAEFTCKGGVPPYNWSVTEGILPEGILLETNTLRGEINETRQDVKYNFRIQVTDAADVPASDSKMVTLTVNPKEDDKKGTFGLWAIIFIALVVISVIITIVMNALGYESVWVKKNRR